MTADKQPAPCGVKLILHMHDIRNSHGSGIIFRADFFHNLLQLAVHLELI